MGDPRLSTTTTVAERVLTVRQPWADLIMAGVKDVENRTWPVPSTIEPWFTCPYCPVRWRAGEPTPAGRCGGGGAHHGPAQVDGPFPFRLWIHAGMSATTHDYNRALLAVRGDADADAWIRGWRDNRDQTYGALLGSVTVTGCHEARRCKHGRGDRWTVGDWFDDVTPRYCSRWAEPDAHHWTLADPQPLAEPIPMRGRQGLWTLDPGQHDGHDTPICCLRRGPRIGSEGRPVCKREAGHEGRCAPADDDGWGAITWPGPTA